MRHIPDVLIYGSALAISSALNFVALVVWTHLLTPAQFGAYSLGVASSLLINATAFEWLRLTAARSLSDSSEPHGVSRNRTHSFSALVLVVGCLLLLTCLVLWLTGIRLSGLPSSWWLIVGAFALSELLLGIFNTLSRFRLLPWQYFRSMAGRGILSVITGLVLVEIFRFGAVGAILGGVIGQWIMVLGGLAADPFWRTVRPDRASTTELKALLRFGAPLILGCAMNYAVGVTDRFIISHLMDTAAVGLYSAPFDLMQKTVVFLMLAINLTAYPAIVRAYDKDGPDAARRLLNENFLLQFTVALPATIGLIALAPGIGAILLGASFHGAAAQLFPIMAAAALLRSFIQFHLNLAFQLVNRTRLMIVAPAVSLIVLVTVGSALTSKIGLIGMASAAVCAQSIGYIIALVLAKRVFEVRVISWDLLRVVLASAAMGGALWPMRGHVHTIETLLLIAVGTSIYGLVLVLAGFRPSRLYRSSHKQPFCKSA